MHFSPFLSTEQYFEQATSTPTVPTTPTGSLAYIPYYTLERSSFDNNKQQKTIRTDKIYLVDNQHHHDEHVLHPLLEERELLI
jgi:hypothetical protein